MTHDQKQGLFPVPAFRGGEHRNRGTGDPSGSSQDRLQESSGNVPGTTGNGTVPRSPTLYRGTEERGTENTRRKPYRVKARPTEWDNADGTRDELVKLFGGSRGSMALDYSEVPRLIEELARFLHQHNSARS